MDFRDKFRGDFSICIWSNALGTRYTSVLKVPKSLKVQDTEGWGYETASVVKD